MQKSQILLASVFGLFTAGLSTATAAPTSPDLLDLTLSGSAKILTVYPPGKTIIFLTPAESSLSGGAFTTNRVTFGSNYAFSTFFQFRMTNPGGSSAADGIVFVLQTDSASALGPGAGNLGYLGITPSVGVEFDTFYNPPYDVNGNHVAILLNGQITGIDSQSPYGVANCTSPTGVFGCLGNGDLWSVWIEYDGANLNVAVADNSTIRPANLITYPIDISSTLGQSSAFVGFTAGTGGGWETHSIIDWQFSTTSGADSK